MPKAWLTRRNVLGGIAAAAGLAAAGCGRSERNASERSAQRAGVAAQPAAMTVYRDPGCGCCEHWTGIARNAGYRVRLVDDQNMPEIKRRYGVPDALVACHTAVVADYVVEGHVPLDDVKRLLAQRPANIKGIAVAGMPVGSPGMEVPGVATEPFQVMAFDAAGRITRFSG